VGAYIARDKTLECIIGDDADLPEREYLVSMAEAYSKFTRTQITRINVRRWGEWSNDPAEAPIVDWLEIEHDPPV
jgi:hypothetical protein